MLLLSSISITKYYKNTSMFLYRQCMTCFDFTLTEALSSVAAVTSRHIILCSKLSMKRRSLVIIKSDVALKHIIMRIRAFVSFCIGTFLFSQSFHYNVCPEYFSVILFFLYF